MSEDDTVERVVTGDLNALSFPHQEAPFVGSDVVLAAFAPQ